MRGVAAGMWAVVAGTAVVSMVCLRGAQAWGITGQEPTLFFSDYSGRIGRMQPHAGPDTNGYATLPFYTNNPAGPGNSAPDAVSVDWHGDPVPRAYWTDWWRNTISYTNLATGGIRVDVVSSGLSNPRGLALDSRVGVRRMYWTDRDYDKISYANMDDGSGRADLLTGLPDALAIVLDAPNGHLYFSDEHSFNQGYLSRIDMAGGGNRVDILVAGGAAGNAPQGFALDLERGWIYFGNHYNDDSDGAIRRVNLDGTSVVDYVTADVKAPYSLYYDDVSDHLYWCDSENDKVWRVDAADGGNKVLVAEIVYPITIAGFRCDRACNTCHGPTAADCGDSEAEEPDCAVGYLPAGGGSFECVAAGGYVVFTSWEQDRIGAASYAGDAMPDLLSWASMADPTSLAVDQAGGMLYYGTTYNLNRGQLPPGTHRVTLIDNVSVRDIRAIALDCVQQQLYWVEHNDHNLKRANLDGSDVQTLVSQALDGGGVINLPTGLVLDLSSRTIYYTNYGGSLGLWRADMPDGANKAQVLSVSRATGLAIDFVNGFLYVADHGNPGAGTNGLVFRADFPSGANMQAITGTDVLGIVDIAVDAGAGVLFVTSHWDGELSAYDLDGTNFRFVADVGTSGVTSGYGVAVVPDCHESCASCVGTGAAYCTVTGPGTLDCADGFEASNGACAAVGEGGGGSVVECTGPTCMAVGSPTLVVGDHVGRLAKLAAGDTSASLAESYGYEGFYTSSPLQWREGGSVAADVALDFNAPGGEVRVFWNDFWKNALFRAPLAGGGATTMMTGFTNNVGVALDSRAGKRTAYVADGVTGRIRMCDMDDAADLGDFAWPNLVGHGPDGILVDTVNEHMYVGFGSPDRIGEVERRNLADGGNPVTVIPADTLDYMPMNFALDVANAVLYVVESRSPYHSMWDQTRGDANTATGWTPGSGLWKVGADGLGLEKLSTTTSDPTYDIFDIALDAGAGHLYFTEFYGPGWGTSSPAWSVWRVDAADGSNKQLVSSGGNTYQPLSLALIACDPACAAAGACSGPGPDECLVTVECDAACNGCSGPAAGDCTACADGYEAGIDQDGNAACIMIGSLRATCQAHLDASGGAAGDGAYWVQPDPDAPPFRTHCLMTADDGGWTLVVSYPETQTPLETMAAWPDATAASNADPFTTRMFKGNWGAFAAGDAREEIASGAAVVWASGLSTSELGVVQQLYAYGERVAAAPQFSDVPNCRTSYAGVSDDIVGCTTHEDAQRATVLGWQDDVHSASLCWAGRGDCVDCSSRAGSSLCPGEPDGSKYSRLYLRERLACDAGFYRDSSSGSCTAASGRLFVANYNLGRWVTTPLDEPFTRTSLTSMETSGPSNVAFDQVNGHAYYTDRNGVLRRADLPDGTNVVTLLDGLEDPRGLALDIQNKFVYFCSVGNGWGRIISLDLESGTASTRQEHTGYHPSEPVLDLAAGHMYWTDGALGVLRRADLPDVSDDSTVDVVTTGLVFPTGLAVDFANGYFYIADQAWGAPGGAVGTISRADFPSGDNVVALVSNLNEPIGVAVDAGAGWLYYTLYGGVVTRTNLLGGDAVVVGSDFGSTMGAALLLDCDPACASCVGSGPEHCARTGPGGAPACADDHRADGDGVCVACGGACTVGCDPGAYPDASIPGGCAALGAESFVLFGSFEQDRVAGVTYSGASVADLAMDVDLPMMIAVDRATGTLYLADRAGPQSLSRATLPSGDDEVVLIAEPNICEISGVAVDPAQGHVYWTQVSACGSLRRINADGTNPATLLDKAVAGAAFVNQPQDIVLDLENRHMYFTDVYGTGVVRRANMADGGNPATVFALGDRTGVGLDIDFVNEHFYAVMASSGSPTPDGALYRADFPSGSNAAVLISGLNNPLGVAVDAGAGLIVVAEHYGGRVLATDLSGGSARTLAETGSLDTPSAYGVVVMPKCHAACATCVGSGPQYCSVTGPGQVDCADGFVADAGGVCIDPDAGCDDGLYYDADAATCTACSGGCPSGAYVATTCTDSGDRMCAACHPTCGNCTGAAASQCADADGDGDLDCAAGYFDGGEGKCAACHRACATCGGPLPTECAGAVSGGGLDCSDGYVEIAGECVYAGACNSTCLTCSGPSAAHCVVASRPGSKLWYVDNHALRYADLDTGDNGATAASVGTIADVDVDLTGRHVYHTDLDSGAVVQVALDGFGRKRITNDVRPTEVFYDHYHNPGVVYFIDGKAGTLSRVGSDGTNREDLVGFDDGLSPTAFTVDPEGDNPTLFVISNPADAGEVDAIWRFDIDGGNPSLITDSSADTVIQEPNSITTDSLFRPRVFVSDRTRGAISYIDTDDGSRTDMITGLEVPGGLVVGGFTNTLYFVHRQPGTSELAVASSTVYSAAYTDLVTANVGGYGLGVDLVNNHVFYHARDPASYEDQINRADLPSGANSDVVVAYWDALWGATNELVDIAVNEHASPAQLFFTRQSGALTTARAAPNDIQARDVFVSRVRAPYGVAADAGAKYLFFSDYELGTVGRVSLEATGVAFEDTRVDIVEDAGDPRGLALDSSAQALYYTDMNAGEVVRVDYTGNSRSVLVRDATSGPWSLALDAGAALLYVSDYRHDVVYRVDAVSGADRVEVVTSGATRPFGIALDSRPGAAATDLFWSDADARSISRAHLGDGSAAVLGDDLAVSVLVAGLDEPGGISVAVCDPGCLACNGALATDCTDTNGDSEPDCAPGYSYDVTPGACVPDVCSEACASCTGTTPADCTDLGGGIRDCAEGFRASSGSGVCWFIVPCPATQWFDSDTDQCLSLTTCGPTEFELVAPTTTSDRECEDVSACATQCPAGRYMASCDDGSTPTCEQCDSGCNTCTGPGDGDCVVLAGGVRDCAAGSFHDVGTDRCLACDPDVNPAVVDHCAEDAYVLTCLGGLEGVMCAACHASCASCNGFSAAQCGWNDNSERDCAAGYSAGRAGGSGDVCEDCAAVCADSHQYATVCTAGSVLCGGSCDAACASCVGPLAGDCATVDGQRDCAEGHFHDRFEDGGSGMCLSCTASCAATNEWVSVCAENNVQCGGTCHASCTTCVGGPTDANCTPDAAGTVLDCAAGYTTAVRGASELYCTSCASACASSHSYATSCGAAGVECGGQCHAACKTCTGPAADECTIVSATQRECASGYFTDVGAGECSSCAAHCDATGEWVESCTSAGVTCGGRCDPTCERCTGPQRTDCSIDEGNRPACAADYWSEVGGSECTACAATCYPGWALSCDGQQGPTCTDSAAIVCADACSQCTGPSEEHCFVDAYGTTSCATGHGPHPDVAGTCVECTHACDHVESTYVQECAPDVAPTCGSCASGCYACEGSSEADCTCSVCPPGTQVTRLCGAFDPALPAGQVLVDAECTACPLPHTCAGGPGVTLNATCVGEGVDPDSLLCGSCLPNYYPLLGSCRECPGAAGVLPVLFGLMACGAVGFLVQRGTLNAGGEQLLRSLAVQIQVINIHFSFSVPWPDWAREWVRQIQALIFDVALYSPRCTLQGGWYVTFAITIGFVALLLGVTAGLRHAIGAMANKRTTASTGAESAADSLYQKYQRLGMLLATIGLLAYVPLLRTLLEALDCVQTHEGPVLQHDVNIACDTPGHILLMVVCGVAALVLGLGLPLWTIFHFRRVMKNKAVADDKWAARLRAIRDPYRDDRPYFEGVMLLHRAVSVWMLVSFASGLAQSVVVLLATLGVLALTIRLRPYKSMAIRHSKDAMNSLAILALSAQAITLLCGLLSDTLVSGAPGGPQLDGGDGEPDEAEDATSADVLGALASAVAGGSTALLAAGLVMHTIRSRRFASGLRRGTGKARRGRVGSAGSDPGGSGDGSGNGRLNDAHAVEMTAFGGGHMTPSPMGGLVLGVAEDVDYITAEGAAREARRAKENRIQQLHAEDAHLKKLIHTEKNPQPRMDRRRAIIAELDEIGELMQPPDLEPVQAKLRPLVREAEHAVAVAVDAIRCAAPSGDTFANPETPTPTPRLGGGGGGGGGGGAGMSALDTVVIDLSHPSLANGAQRVRVPGTVPGGGVAPVVTVPTGGHVDDVSESKERGGTSGAAEFAAAAADATAKVTGEDAAARQVAAVLKIQCLARGGVTRLRVRRVRRTKADAVAAQEAAREAEREAAAARAARDAALKESNEAGAESLRLRRIADDMESKRVDAADAADEAQRAAEAAAAGAASAVRAHGELAKGKPEAEAHAADKARQALEAVKTGAKAVKATHDLLVKAKWFGAAGMLASTYFAPLATIAGPVSVAAGVGLLVLDKFGDDDSDDDGDGKSAGGGGGGGARLKLGKASPRDYERLEAEYKAASEAVSSQLSLLEQEALLLQKMVAASPDATATNARLAAVEKEIAELRARARAPQDTDARMAEAQRALDAAKTAADAAKAATDAVAEAAAAEEAARAAAEAAEAEAEQKAAAAAAADAAAREKAAAAEAARKQALSEAVVAGDDAFKVEAVVERYTRATAAARQMAEAAAVARDKLRDAIDAASAFGTAAVRAAERTASFTEGTSKFSSGGAAAASLGGDARHVRPLSHANAPPGGAPPAAALAHVGKLAELRLSEASHAVMTAVHDVRAQHDELVRDDWYQLALEVKTQHWDLLSSLVAAVKPVDVHARAAKGVVKQLDAALKKVVKRVTAAAKREEGAADVGHYSRAAAAVAEQRAELAKFTAEWRRTFDKAGNWGAAVGQQLALALYVRDLGISGVRAAAVLQDIAHRQPETHGSDEATLAAAGVGPGVVATLQHDMTRARDLMSDMDSAAVAEGQALWKRAEERLTTLAARCRKRAKEIAARPRRQYSGASRLVAAAEGIEDLLQ